MHNGFNDVAFLYDDLFTESTICKYQRKLVWQYLQETLTESKNILETNCGTGEDALFLQGCGHTVTATDGAQNMITVTKKKLTQNAIDDRNIFLWDLNTPFPRTKQQQYDIVYSNFGGWNCLSGEVLCNVAAELSQLVKPGGRIIVILITKYSWWETSYYLLKFNFRQAFRRLKNTPVKARLTKDAFIDTYYHSTKQMRKYMQPHFRLNRTLPAGFFVPPSYLEGFFIKHPRLLKILYDMDMKTRHRSLLTFGADQYILEFERI